MISKPSRITIILILVAIILIYEKCPCLLVRYSGLPESIKSAIDTDVSKLVFIYETVCIECPSGQSLLGIRDRSDVIVIVPSNSSPIDIDNLIRTFGINQKIIYGDTKAEKMLQRVAKCMAVREWKRTYMFAIDKQKRIKSIKLL